VAGFVAGVVGGITNVPGTPLAMYFYALGMSKTDFLAFDRLHVPDLQARPDRRRRVVRPAHHGAGRDVGAR